MRSPYPQCNKESDILKCVQKIVQLRQQEDITDYTNQVAIKLPGRLTFRIPSSNSDIVVGQNGDQLGDITNDGTYQYNLIKVGNSLVWNRTALNITW